MTLRQAFAFFAAVFTIVPIIMLGIYILNSLAAAGIISWSMVFSLIATSLPVSALIWMFMVSMSSVIKAFKAVNKKLENT